MKKNLLSLFGLETGGFWRLNSGKSTCPILPIEIDKSGKVTQYVKRLYLKKGHSYILSFYAKCTNYKSGALGVGINGVSNNLSISKETNDFIYLEKK